MAAFRPLCSGYWFLRCRHLARFSLSSRHGFDSNYNGQSSRPKLLSELLRFYAEKPALDKEVQKNIDFFYFLHANLHHVITKKYETFLGGYLSVEEFDKITMRVGLSKLCNEEIKQFFLKPSFLFSYITCNGSSKLLGIYVSKKDSHQYSSVLSNFEPRWMYDKVVILLKSNEGKIITKVFSNVSSVDSGFLLPGSTVRGSVPYKILLSALVVSSFSSASASLLFEIVNVPSNSMLFLTYISTLFSSYIWGKWKDSQSSHLSEKCKVLNTKSNSMGDLAVALMKNEVTFKIFLDVLILYSYLLREKEANLRREFEYVKVDDRFKRMFYKWSSEELGLSKMHFDFDEILKFMEKIEMVRVTDNNDSQSSFYEVIPFNAVLSSLKERERTFSRKFGVCFLPTN